MADYIYKTSLYTDTSVVSGVPATNTADLADFTTNHAGDVVDIDELTIAETSFQIEKSYEDFDALVDTPYSWTNVRCWTDHNSKHLYLVATSPLE